MILAKKGVGKGRFCPRPGLPVPASLRKPARLLQRPCCFLESVPSSWQAELDLADF